MACSSSRSTGTTWLRSDRAPSWVSGPRWPVASAPRRSGRRPRPGSPRRARSCLLPSHWTVWPRCTGARPRRPGRRRATDAWNQKSLAPSGHQALSVCAGLLDLDLRALLLEGSLDLVRLVACDAFLDGLRSRVDQVLGLLEAQAGQLADDLDDRDLVRADLREDSAELGLLFSGGSATSGLATATGGRRGSDGDGRSGRDVVALLELLDEIGQLEDRHLVDRFEQVVLGEGVCHGFRLDPCGVRVCGLVGE